MAVSLEMLKEFVGSLASKAETMVLANFVIWLDIKVAEYKVMGEVCWGKFRAIDLMP